MPNPGNRQTPLDAADIEEMRNLRASGGKKATLSYLSWLYETTQSNVHLIVTGQTHKEVGGPVTPVREPTTEAEVLEIRNMRAVGYSYAELSGEFGKSEVALRSICSGQSFPHFGGPRSGQVPEGSRRVGRPAKRRSLLSLVSGCYRSSWLC